MSDTSSEAPKQDRLPGNSYTGRTSKKEEPPTDRPQLEKVVQGATVQKKRGFGKKIKETFGGDDARSVGSYIFFDVILPAAKAMLADAASQGAERLLFGDSRGRSRAQSQRGPGRTSYSRMYGSDNDRSPRRELSSRARATHDFDEIYIESRGEAEAVLDQLTILVDDYDHAKVSDYYELVGVTSNPQDQRWGWTDLRGARISLERGGYLVILPRTVPID